MSAVTFNPYLFFTGNCKEAMEFYKEVFGGNVEYAMFEGMPEMDGKVMHAHLTGGLIEFMASDGMRTEPYGVCSITLSLGGKDTEVLTGLFNKLAEGGKIDSPLKVEAWGDTFGTLTDKFGTDWMVNIAA